MDFAEYRKWVFDGGEVLFRREIPAVEGHPLVTVITPVRNGEAHIERNILSVRAQTYPAIEHIIADGLSSDATVAFALRHQDCIGQIISGEDQSGADAINKAISVARGDYIAILPADDAYDPSYVQNCVRALCWGGADFVFGDLVYLREGRDPLLIPGEPDYQRSIRYCLPNMSTISMMYRREAFEKIGPLDITNVICNDYDWVLRAHIRGLRGGYDPTVRAYFSHGGISTENYGQSAAMARDVAIRHGGSRVEIYVYYWRALFRHKVRNLLEQILPPKIYYAILRRATRTGARPLSEFDFPPYSK